MEEKASSVYMRPDRAAEYLGISRRFLSKLTASRALPYIRLGRRCVLFSAVDLERALNRFRVNAVGEMRK